MAAPIPKIQFNNGEEIPLVGLGTWKSQPGEVTTAVHHALTEGGYRHIDCAQAYANEKEVGEGIKMAGVPREELFLTGKVWLTWLNRVEEALDNTLAQLGTDYLDLYLVHWPLALNPNGNHPRNPTTPDGKRDVVYDWDMRETWRQMEAVQKKGKVRSIGISNFSIPKIEELLKGGVEIMPVCNQLELHPYNPEHKLVNYCLEKGMKIQAYSPLGSAQSTLHQDEAILEIAEKRGLNVQEVLLGYLVARGIVVVPKSVTPARITANNKGAFRGRALLEQEDIEKLNGLAASGKARRFVTCPWPMDIGLENWPKIEA